MQRTGLLDYAFTSLAQGDCNLTSAQGWVAAEVRNGLRVRELVSATVAVPCFGRRRPKVTNIRSTKSSQPGPKLREPRFHFTVPDLFGNHLGNRSVELGCACEPQMRKTTARVVEQPGIDCYVPVGVTTGFVSRRIVRLHMWAGQLASFCLCGWVLQALA